MVAGDVPDEDYYPTQKKYRAKYSDGTEISFDSKPNILKVKIVGEMTNTRKNPYTDNSANRNMWNDLRKGDAKYGYYYINIGEDAGSVSVVVPNKSFIKIIK